jgi:hypothetical protein
MPMTRRSLLLGLLLAPFAAMMKPSTTLTKPLVIGRVINLPRNQDQLARLIREATEASDRYARRRLT